MQEFYLKNGHLSAYGLNCGYVQKYPQDVELFKAHTLYCVDQMNGAFQSFESLTEARRFAHKVSNSKFRCTYRGTYQGRMFPYPTPTLPG